jgi:hypothetical protein
MEADLNALRKGLSQIDKEIHNLPDDSRDPFKKTMQVSMGDVGVEGKKERRRSEGVVCTKL